MAVTFPLNMPSNNLASVSMSLTNANAATESPFSLQQQIVGFDGQRWNLSFAPPPMVRNQAEEWNAFQLALRGIYGTFLAGDPAGILPRGSAGGVPLVKGAGQTGRQLIIDGATPNQTNWLRKGDYFQLGTGVNSRLYKLVENANSDGSGQVVLVFEPSLRSSPADNAPLVVEGARGCFRMTSNTPAWSVDTNKHYRISFDAIEVL